MNYCIVYGFKNGMKIVEKFENEKIREETYSAIVTDFLVGDFLGRVVDGQAFRGDDIFIIAKADVKEEELDVQQ